MMEDLNTNNKISESLVIKNLGPLTDIVMADIRPVMVLLGKTGSGKSLILKVLAMMRHVCKRQLIRRTLKESGVKKTSFKIRKDSYLKFADIDVLVNGKTLIVYKLSCTTGVACKVTFNKSGFDVIFNESRARWDAGPFMKIAFISDTRNLLASWARKGASIQSKVLDNYFAETYDLWDEAIVAKMSSLQTIDYLGSRLAIMKGESGRREISIVSSNGQKTLFERGASGEKASIPVAIILRYLVKSFDFEDAMKRSFASDFLEAILEKNHEQMTLSPLRENIVSFERFYMCIHIEEPELSLDPLTQLHFADDVMKTMESMGDLQRKVDASLVFTTHSPYWVTALNTIAEERKYTFLTWNRLCGYLVKDDGMVSSLRDEDAHLLMTPNLDRASIELDERYNAALDKEGVAI